MGRLESATLLLKIVGHSQPFLWNTAIRNFEQHHKSLQAINFFHLMLHNNVCADKFTYPFVLKACAKAQALKEGEQVHSRIMKSPLIMDLFIQGSLIFMYACCGQMESAHVAFEAMIHKNLISWNMMIDGYVKNGDIDSALKLFERMPERDLFSWNLMIDGFSKQGQVEFARKLFDEMSVRDIISWNSMIDGYAKCGNMTMAKDLFDQVPLKDEVTWGIMMNGYANCNQIKIAHTLFEKLPHKNLITWNALIRGYVKYGNIMEAYELFLSMPWKNLTSWNIMIDAFVKHRNMQLACELFNVMPMRDVISWNIIVDGHAKLGLMEGARELFDIMPSRDVVSWNAMIAGYKENGLSKEAIELFFDMHYVGEKPDCTTLVIVLSAIADLGTITQGRWVHSYAKRNEFPFHGDLGVALVDMYCKCGYVDIARDIFDGIHLKDIDHWNAMIIGLAIHGYGRTALSLFSNMEQCAVTPDDITFIGILNACSHAGLVHEGHKCFKLMNCKYGMIPKIQHYGCMVDLLSRAGHLKAAVTLVNHMPMAPNDFVWRTLLGASRNCGNIEIAEYAMKHLIELAPHDSCSYVLLSNIYLCKGQYGNARDIWKVMDEKGVLKDTGTSYIELCGFVHQFSAGDTSHPQIVEIYLLLEHMTRGLMSAGYLPQYNTISF